MISHSAMALSSFFKLPHGGKLCISQSSVIARGSTRELLSFPHLPAGNASTHILIYPPSRWFHDATDIIYINIYLCNFMYVYLIHDLYSFFFYHPFKFSWRWRDFSKKNNSATILTWMPFSSSSEHQDMLIWYTAKQSRKRIKHQKLTFSNGHWNSFNLRSIGKTWLTDLTAVLSEDLAHAYI